MNALVPRKLHTWPVGSSKATTVLVTQSALSSKGLQSSCQSGCTVENAVSLLDVGWEVLQWF